MAASAEARQNILIYGDSLSAGYGLASNEGFAPQLEQALKAKGKRIKIFNASQSGETTRGGLARLKWTLDNLPAMHIAIIELGANDALRTLSPQRTKENLSKMIAILQKRKIKVLLTGMLAPPNLGEVYGKAFNSLYPALAKNYKVRLYPFFLEEVATKRALNLKDGIHPNAKGVKIIVSNIMPFVLETLESRINEKANGGKTNGISSFR